ncbi:MAG: adenylate/guanylate cyclase domain-containing protein [Spirochaetota bacterium]
MDEERVNRLTEQLQSLPPNATDKKKIDLQTELAWELAHKQKQRSFALAEEALASSRQHSYPRGEAFSLHIIAYFYLFSSQLAKALEYIQESLAIYESLEDAKGLAMALNTKSVALIHLGNYSDALPVAYKSLQLFQAQKDLKWTAWLYHSIAEIYLKTGDFTNSIQNFSDSLNIFQEIRYGFGIGVVSFFLAQAYYEKMEDKQSFRLYSRSIYRNRKYNNYKGVVDALLGIGKIFERQKNNQATLRYYQKAEKMLDKVHHQDTHANVMVSLAKVWLDKEEITKAKFFLNRALQIAEDLAIKQTLKLIHYTYTLYYEKLKDFSRALQHHKLYYQYNEELFNEENTRKIENLKIQFQVEKAEELVQVERQKAKEIALEKQKSDQLLLNILPQSVANELKTKGKVEPVYHESVSILFTDFKGFTKSVSEMSAEDLIQRLDQVFQKFDEICDRNALEKIKTIGDAYMCVGGMPEPSNHHIIHICLAALQMKQIVREMQEQAEKANDIYWDIRIGIHVGAVMAGVIGQKKFSYDLWGDSVNIASRMESKSEAAKINVSRKVYENVNKYFQFQTRGSISVKGKGELDMFFLERLRPEYSSDSVGCIPNVTLTNIL